MQAISKKFLGQERLQFHTIRVFPIFMVYDVGYLREFLEQGICRGGTDYVSLLTLPVMQGMYV